MKKFIINTALFVSMLAAIILGLNTCVHIGLKKKENIWNHIYSKKLNYDIIFSGSSRGVVHFNPAVFDSILGVNSFNISMDGNSFESQIIRLRAYINNNQPPKLIVLNCDPFELQHTILSEAQSFKPYMSDTTVSNQLRRINKVPGYYYYEISKYYGDYKSIFQGLTELSGLVHYKEDGFKGYLPEIRAFNTKELEILENAPRDNIFICNQSALLLERFVKECRIRGIEVLLVQSPTCFEKQKSIANFKLVNEGISKRAIFNNLEYFDFSTDSICGMKKYFYNSTHLNKSGSIVLSEKICHRIQNCPNLLKAIQR